MPIIETHDLTKRFGKTLAVDGVSLRVERGQVFGFLGPNGSGKTTTIGMLLGILRPTSGSFRIFGEEAEAGHVPAHALRRRIGATLEQPNFYPYLSGRDNLRLAARIKGVSGERIEEMLDLAGLGRHARRKFHTYSLGMKQRLALAATLLGDPELVILDEPTNGLDPEGMREVRQLIRALGERGKTVFLSSHLLGEVERTCTHVAILRKGRILRQASVEEVTGGRIRYALGTGSGRGSAAPDGPVGRSVGGAGGRDGGSAGGNEELRAAVEAYPASAWVGEADGMLLVELEDDDPAALNRYLAGRGVYLGYLAPQPRSLEDVFLELTGGGELGMGEVE